jgi:microcin C transport system substrate-binding protein
VAYNAWRLERPQAMPPYAQAEGWAMETWWAKPEMKKP